MFLFSMSRKLTIKSTRLNREPIYTNYDGTPIEPVSEPASQPVLESNNAAAHYPQLVISEEPVLEHALEQAPNNDIGKTHFIGIDSCFNT